MGNQEYSGIDAAKYSITNYYIQKTHKSVHEVGHNGSLLNCDLVHPAV